jgi:hypothetical protein
MSSTSVYQYNQRAEVLVPIRTGTTYYGPTHARNLVVYKGLNIDIEFFAKDTDRKPQSLHNKTYTATLIDRLAKTTLFTRDLQPIDYDTGELLLRLDHSTTDQLDAKLYDMVITYKVANQNGSYAVNSDQNSRITFAIDVKEGNIPGPRPSETDSSFTPNGDDRFSGRLTGPVLNSSKSGLNTMQVYYSNYTGVYTIQATLNLQPTDSDFFDVSGQTHTVSGTTAIDYHTFTGMYTFVRLKHTPAVGNAGTLDKVVYRS